jgi:hypothetical protein
MYCVQDTTNLEVCERFVCAQVRAEFVMEEVKKKNNSEKVGEPEGVYTVRNFPFVFRFPKILAEKDNKIVFFES